LEFRRVLFRSAPTPSAAAGPCRWTSAHRARTRRRPTTVPTPSRRRRQGPSPEGRESLAVRSRGDYTVGAAVVARSQEPSRARRVPAALRRVPLEVVAGLLRAVPLAL